MSDMQKEDNKEAKKKEDKGSLVSPAPPRLEDEIKDTGWSVKMLQQTDTSVTFRVFCSSREGDWYTLIVKCPKNKFKKIGL